MSDTIRTTEQIIADMISARDGNTKDVAKKIAEEVLNQQGQSTPMDGMGRQLGLTARAGIEGAASVVDLVQAPLAATMNMAFGTDYKPLREQVSSALTSIGVPEPEDGTERVVQAISQAMVGGGGTAAVAQRLAKVLGGMPKAFADAFAAQLGQQVVAGGAGGGAGQLTAEAGGNVWMQIAASLVGGGVGGRAAGTKFDPLPEDVPATIKSAEDAGVRVMTSDVRSPETFAGKTAQKAGESVPIVGTAKPRADQQGERIEYIRDVLLTYGADNAVMAADNVMVDLLKTRSANLKKYSGLKNNVIDDMKDAGIVDVSRAVGAIDEQVARIRLLNLEQNTPIIKTLMELRKALLNERQITMPNGRVQIEARGQSLPQIEQLRKSVGQAFGDPSMASIKQLGEDALQKIYGPINEDMGAFIQANGRRRDYTKWKAANTRLAEIAGELSNTTLKNALKKGDMTPETIRSLLFSTKPSDVRILYRNLGPAGKANARSALLYEALQKSGGDLAGAKNVADGAVSPDRFKNQLKKLSNATGIMFSGDDLRAVEGLERVLSMTQRAGDANVAPLTGVMMQIPLLSGFLTSTFGGVAGGIVAATGIGGLARIYESAPVRNILMKIPQTRSGSPEEIELIKRLTETIRYQSSIDEEAQATNQDTSQAEIGLSPAANSIIQGLTNDAAEKVQQAAQ
tara:strand:- start:580 stop:2634 length:2055 start_codon:yes stop_codon:yes gene_type:complete